MKTGHGTATSLACVFCCGLRGAVGAGAGGLRGGGQAGAVGAAAQAKGYPGLGPRCLAAAPAQAFAQALAAARAMGWTIVAAEPAAGRIEATASTRWLGFKDDVVVRIRPDAGGSRVDVR